VHEHRQIGLPDAQPDVNESTIDAANESHAYLGHMI